MLDMKELLQGSVGGSETAWKFKHDPATNKVSFEANLVDLIKVCETKVSAGKLSASGNPSDTYLAKVGKIQFQVRCTPVIVSKGK